MRAQLRALWFLVAVLFAMTLWQMARFTSLQGELAEAKGQLRFLLAENGR